MKAYGFRDVLKFTGATRSNLIHWTNTGVIRAAISDTSGPGDHRQFSFRNLVEAKIAAELNGFRLPLVVIAQALKLIDALAAHDSRVSAGVAVWESFIDPARREDGAEALLLVSGGKGVELTIGRELSLNTEQLGAAWITINVGLIVRVLERVTNDRWTITNALVGKARRRAK